jgi:hypothetical protein
MYVWLWRWKVESSLVSGCSSPCLPHHTTVAYREGEKGAADAALQTRETIVAWVA